MQSQLVKSGLLLICKTKLKNLGLALGLFLHSMIEAIGCYLALFIFSYNCFKKNEVTRPKVKPFKMHHALNAIKQNGQSNKQLKDQREHYFTTICMGCKPEANVDVNECFRMLVMVLN